jgi:uncharacterized coiled-coil DUF342 family protein
MGVDGNELLKAFDEEKRAVSSLRSDLNKFDSKIRDLSGRRKTVGREIAAKLRRLKVLRDERNALTDEVKKFKEKRSEFQLIVKKKVMVVKELQKKMDDFTKKSGIRTNPAQLKREIESIELRIETEGVTFNVEKKLMKELKDLNKKFEQTSDVSGIWNEIHAADKEIKLLKNENDEVHKQVQVKAAESQNRHEELVALSKEVDKLRKDEKELLAQIDSIQLIFDEVKKKLESELGRLQDVGSHVQSVKDAKRKKQQRKKEKMVEDMSKDVEEKMKKGEKLTTEDLLAFQAKSE